MVSASQLPPPPSLVKEAPRDQKWTAVDGPPREAEWWYATFHSVTAMTGAGVLSLPHVIAYLGWGSCSSCIAVYNTQHNVADDSSVRLESGLTENLIKNFNSMGNIIRDIRSIPLR